MAKMRPRWSYATNAILVFAAQLWMLEGRDWSVIKLYTVQEHNPWWLVLIIFLHLLWGISNLIGFINYKANYDDSLDDIGKDE